MLQIVNCASVRVGRPHDYNDVHYAGVIAENQNDKKSNDVVCMRVNIHNKTKDHYDAAHNDMKK